MKKDMIQVTGRSSLETVNELWNKASPQMREKLLTSMGFHKSFAIVENMEEMKNRGGAMIVKYLISIFERSQQKKYGPTSNQEKY